MNIIDTFRGEYAFLSNYYTGAGASFEGDYYVTSEHAYQAAKTLNVKERELIKQSITPAESKELGRKITIRSDWDQIKYGVMHQILKSKFNNDNMRRRLLNTGDAYLIEGNTWGDKVWGVCDGEGENWLGRLLMLIRSELQYEYRNKE